MPLPTWMRGHRAADTDTREVWNGERLAARNVVNDADMHYRIYNAATREVLSFGSVAGPGTLNAIVMDAVRLHDERPDVQLHVEQFDGPAYPTGGE